MNETKIVLQKVPNDRLLHSPALILVHAAAIDTRPNIRMSVRSTTVGRHAQQTCYLDFFAAPVLVAIARETLHDLDMAPG